MADGDVQVTSQQMLASGPPSVGGPGLGPTTPQYLGVPEGYRSPRVRPPGATRYENPDLLLGDAAGYRGSTAPLYTESDIFAPTGLSAERVAQLQRMMDAAGVFRGATYRLGVWDATSQRAYQTVLEYANVAGIDVNEALDELVASPQKTATPETPDPGSIDKVSAPMTLEAQVQQAAQQRLGRKLRKSEVSKFVALYQGLERKDNAAFRSAQDTAKTGKDVELVQQAPGADVAAEDFVGEQFGQEAAAQDAYGYFDALKNLLGG